MYETLTDEALAELIAKNDAKALEILFNRYYQDLCQFCAVYTKDYEAAEEIIADLFIKLWDGRKLEHIASMRSYLFTAARNLSLNYAQKKKDPVTFIEDIAPAKQNFQDINTPFRILSGRDSSATILQAIEKLPERQREVLLMSRIDQMDKHKIAGLLNISVRTVETTLYQSIKELRRLLKGSSNIFKILVYIFLTQA